MLQCPNRSQSRTMPPTNDLLIEAAEAAPPGDVSPNIGLDDSYHHKRKRAPSSFGVGDADAVEKAFACQARTNNGSENEHHPSDDVNTPSSVHDSEIQPLNGNNQLVDRPTKRPSFGFGNYAIMDPSSFSSEDISIDEKIESAPAACTQNTTAHTRENPNSILSNPDGLIQRVGSSCQNRFVAPMMGTRSRDESNAAADDEMCSAKNSALKPQNESVDSKPVAIERNQRTTACDIRDSKSHLDIDRADSQNSDYSNAKSIFANLEAELVQNASTILGTTTNRATKTQTWDSTNSHARSIFASIESDLVQNERCQSENRINSASQSWACYSATRAQSERSAYDGRDNKLPHGTISSGDARSKNVFANLEAEIMQMNNPLSNGESLDRSCNVFAGIEAELTQHVSSGYGSYDTGKISTAPTRSRTMLADLEAEITLEKTEDQYTSDTKPAAAVQIDPRNNTEAEPMDLDVKPATIPIHAEPIQQPSDGTDVSASDREAAMSHSRSIFANIEEELTRQSEEENQRAHALMQFLTSNKSSVLASSGGGSIGRWNSSNAVYNPNNDLNENEMAPAEEEGEEVHMNEMADHAIDNIEILDQQEPMNNEQIPQHPLPLQPAERPQANSFAFGLGSQRSRDIIAGIEADILRRQQEEIRAEANFNRGMFRNQMVIGPYSANFYPTALASSRREQNNATFNTMLMHQHRQSIQTNSANIVDQVSNMAIDPVDDVSVNSVESCISYDGKTTNIFSIVCQTHEQDMACQMLNRAVNDVLNAPVMPILREFPMLTRFVRADDDSGDIQLHYAVRAGNSKAIRRILRVDPSCAMIRNVQGYCPLHTAAQIGNFAATQLLCSMVPASAEVQCEEGCVPLHEALITGAHHPDAPQIIATLAAAFPSSVKLTNDEGLLPIHLAAMSGSTHGLRTILGFGLSSIFARENTEEMLALDFAVDGLLGVMEEEEEDLLQLDHFQQCVRILLMSALYNQPVLNPERDENFQFLPLHGAAVAQPCRRSWTHLISTYGHDYGGITDASGKTPLHTLLSSILFQDDLVTQAVLSISDMHPTCLTHFDDNGFIPLHTALTNRMPLSVIQSLVQCNGSSISIPVSNDCPDISLRRTFPFQLAASSGSEEDVIYLLLRSAPDLIMQ